MMKKIIKITLVALVVLLSSCEAEDIMLFGDANYIHFKESSEKEIRFSFATNPGIDNYELKIPVVLIGLALDSDEEYSVIVDEENSTASASTYELLKQEFRKSVYEDTLKIKLIKTAELSQEKKLVLKIKENNNFEPGPAAYTTKNIYISNVLSEPSWWADFEDAFFGDYSDIKYTEFIKATGVSDLSDMEVEEVTSLVREFIYYLRRLDNAGTPAYMEDGVTKILNSINYTNA